MLFVGATASLRAGKGFAAFSSSKFALRGLCQSLAREFGPQGVHVCHVVLDGILWGSRSAERFSMAKEACLLPEYAAKELFHVATQHRSTWTQELDLRPDTERF